MKNVDCKSIGFLIVVMIVALGARFRDLEQPSFTWDEWSTFNASINFHYDGTWHEPIYYGFLYGQLPYFVAHPIYAVVGPRTWVPRFVSAMSGVLVVLGVTVLAIMLMGRWWGAYAGMTAALCPFHLAGSRLGFTQGHIIHTVFIVAALLLVASWKQLRPQWGVWLPVAIGGSLGLAIGTDLLAGFWVLFAGIVALGAVLRRIVGGMDLFWLALGGVVGIAVASPMYFVDPLEAWQAITGGSLTSSSLSGYLWLGEVVDQMPWYYYGVILAVKLSPMLFALSIGGILYCLFRWIKVPPLIRLLVISLWFIIPVSMVDWIGPNYIAAALPVLYILAAYPLHAIWSSTNRASMRMVCLVLAGFVLVGNVIVVAVMHPDYPMTGIHYGERFYGEFQGPAVAHGQWIGEGLRVIADDAGGKPVRVLAFEDMNQSQLIFYSRREGLPEPLKLSSFAHPEEAWGQFDYVLLNQDSRRLISPQHPYNLEINEPLVRHVDENPDRLELLQTFYSGRFPMVWVYRVREAVSDEATSP